jgi:hypothetical protein
MIVCWPDTPRQGLSHIKNMLMASKCAEKTERTNLRFRLVGVGHNDFDEAQKIQGTKCIGTCPSRFKSYQKILSWKLPRSTPAPTSLNLDCKSLHERFEYAREWAGAHSRLEHVNMNSCSRKVYCASETTQTSADNCHTKILDGAHRCRVDEGS